MFSIIYLVSHVGHINGIFTNQHTVNTVNYPNLKRPESTLTENIHQHGIDKNFQVKYSIEDTTTYTIYNTDNHLLFSGPYQVVFKNVLHLEVGGYYIAKYDRYCFIGIDAYFRGHFYQKIFSLM